MKDLKMSSIAQLIIDTALAKGLPISINSDGSVQIGAASNAQSSVPEYISDTVPDLPRGEVSRQVRKLKRIGASSIIKAHRADTIRAAMNAMGWGASVKSTNDPYAFQVTRTRMQPRRKRR